MGFVEKFHILRILNQTVALSGGAMFVPPPLSERGRWHFTHVRRRSHNITIAEGGTAQTQLSHELCPAESEGSAMQFETHPAIKAGRRIINVVCEWIDEDDPGGKMLGRKCWRITCFNQKSFILIEQRTNTLTSASWVASVRSLPHYR